MLGPALPLSLAFLRELAQGLGSQVAPEILPTNVLARTPEMIVWWNHAARLPMFPVRWLMRDRYESDRSIVRVKAPLMIVHGTRDLAVPFALGRKLFELANPPKAFLAVEGAGHLALDERLAETTLWIERAVQRD